MPDPNAMEDALFRFLMAPTWGESRRVLNEHPELLNFGTGVIDILLSQDPNHYYPGRSRSEAVALLKTHRAVLVRCKQVGVARAIAEVEGRGGSGRQSLETERTSPRRAIDAYGAPPDRPHRGWLIFAVAAVLAIAGAGTFVLVNRANEGVPAGPDLALGYARAVLADGPTAYWQFNDPAGSTGYADSSGHRNVLQAGSTKSAPAGASAHSGVGVISTVEGGASTATSLGPLTGTAPRTVEAWFRTTSPGCILTAGAGTHARAFSLCVRDGPPNAPAPGEPGFYLETWDSDIFAPIGNIADGNWHYLALSLTRNKVRLVVDGRQPQAYIWNGSSYGELTAQPFSLPYLPDTAPSPVGLATTGLGDIVGGLTGALAEIAVYPRAVPVAHLIRHYRLVGTV